MFEFLHGSKYLLNSLPFDVAVIKYAQYLHDDKRSSPGATNGQIGPENSKGTRNIFVFF